MFLRISILTHSPYVHLSLWTINFHTGEKTQYTEYDVNKIIWKFLNKITFGLLAMFFWKTAFIPFSKIIFIKIDTFVKHLFLNIHWAWIKSLYVYLLWLCIIIYFNSIGVIMSWKSATFFPSKYFLPKEQG